MLAVAEDKQVLINNYLLQEVVWMKMIQYKSKKHGQLGKTIWKINNQLLKAQVQTIEQYILWQFDKDMPHSFR